MGRSRKASAIVAMTRKTNFKVSFNNFFEFYLLAVHTVKSICIESKKKNITRSEIDAPSGKQRACVASKVANPAST